MLIDRLNCDGMHPFIKLSQLRRRGVASAFLHLHSAHQALTYDFFDVMKWPVPSPFASNLNEVTRYHDLLIKLERLHLNIWSFSGSILEYLDNSMDCHLEDIVIYSSYPNHSVPPSEESDAPQPVSRHLPSGGTVRRHGDDAGTRWTRWVGRMTDRPVIFQCYPVWLLDYYILLLYIVIYYDILDIALLINPVLFFYIVILDSYRLDDPSGSENGVYPRWIHRSLSESRPQIPMVSLWAL